MTIKKNMDPELSIIIAKVLSGEASIEDKNALIRWLGQDTENMKVMQRTESIWTAIEIIDAKHQYNTREAFDRFKTAVNKERRDSGLKRTIDTFLRIAAIVVILTGLSLWLFRSEQNEYTADNAICEVIAPTGSKAQVVLPDGTRVWLNADSKISYRRMFNGKIREIDLEGEGYFEVAKDPDRPFVVNTSDIRVKALGTSFNVKSYPSDSTIVTTLVEGIIVLEQKSQGKIRNKAITLEPDQQAVIYKESIKLPGEEPDGVEHVVRKPVNVLKHRESRIVLSEKVNTQLTTSWKNNYLYFDDETFRDLAVKLERRFGVSFQFMDDKIAQYRFAGKFEDVIIEQVLAALQYAAPFKYTIQDKIVIIYNQSQKPPFQL